MPTFGAFTDVFFAKQGKDIDGDVDGNLVIQAMPVVRL